MYFRYFAIDFDINPLNWALSYRRYPAPRLCDIHTFEFGPFYLRIGG